MTKTNNKQIGNVKLINNKSRHFSGIIENTIRSLHTYKEKNLISTNDYNENMILLENVSLITNNVSQSSNVEFMTHTLQEVNNSLFNILKSIGTDNLDDLLYVIFGNEYLQSIKSNKYKKEKYDLLLKYTHPYKFLNYYGKVKKNNKTGSLCDTDIVFSGKNMDCFDVFENMSFYERVNAIRIIFTNQDKKSIVVYAIVENAVVDCVNNSYVSNVIRKINDSKPNDDIYTHSYFAAFVDNICFKSTLIHSINKFYDFYKKAFTHLHNVKQKSISYIVREFINGTLFEKRRTLILLLLDNNEIDSLYLAYLLYDLLSNDSNDVIDTIEQKTIYDSLPWKLKKTFRDAMKRTIDYTTNLMDINKDRIPLEQQICLLKASSSIKEKAMAKLKEIKSKSEDSGAKARTYLEGLLKIPFGIYKHEFVLKHADNIKTLYHNMKMSGSSETLSVHEIIDMVYNNYDKIALQSKEKNIEIVYNKLITGNKSNILQNIKCYNSILYNNNCKRIVVSNKSKSTLKNDIMYSLLHNIENADLVRDIYNAYNIEYNLDKLRLCNSIQSEWKCINTAIMDNSKILDDAVYGHFEAKRAIERVIGQWMSGNLSGYCFGFEGPPGVGKTTLAKRGLAKCLKDHDGVARPFSFIAIGGTSNGSTLEGHNYTYVGSTWGKIVDILMETKCMNPIIFIDELDKVSKTEHGKEIIGILTHLVDQTQNDEFQDKYFNGINLDLSKVLFIFSYNDVDSIDRILLDRIHRIKFGHLTIEDKVTISKTFLIPELLERIGMSSTILTISDTIIKNIITHYTNESGVRKLKELLYEIIGELNLEIFSGVRKIPIELTFNEIKTKYLKERHQIRPTCIQDESEVGIICGLWANALGMGGIIPIQTKFFPSKTMLEIKLTGMQGDVMKESMNVAKTLAYSLLSTKQKDVLKKEMTKHQCQGIHIHCPEGAVPKDGPSAGTAITTCIFSLLTNQRIRRDVAITGEITLNGSVTAIGGLKEKIVGGIKAGVKTFLYPSENENDFKLVCEKIPYILKEAQFIPISKINDVFKYVFE